MNLTHLRQANLIQLALSRYNKRKGIKLQPHHIRLLYFISKFPAPANRLQIQRFLKGFSFTVSYTQLDKTLSALKVENLINERARKRQRLFSTGPAGTELLMTLEQDLRRLRPDKMTTKPLNYLPAC